MSEPTIGRVTFNTNAAANPMQNTPVFLCQHIEPGYVEPEIIMVQKKAYDTLRKRNEKLEAVAKAARLYERALGRWLDSGLWNDKKDTDERRDALFVALSGLDKEADGHA